MIRRVLRRLKATSWGSWSYNWGWITYRCALAPSVSGPWPRIPLRQHLLNARLWYRFLRSQQYFGGKMFYQSCEELGLEGQRPTEARVAAYGLDQIVTEEDRVLDIGCNTGFFAMRLARMARQVDGVELNPSLVEIGQMVARSLGLRNVTLLCADFNTFKPGGRYDALLAFAVHRWAGSTIEHFGHRLLELVKPGGFVLFESNNLDRDKGFAGDVDVLCSLGFDVVRNVMTDFDCPRRLVVLCRQRDSTRPHAILP